MRDMQTIQPHTLAEVVIKSIGQLALLLWEAIHVMKIIRQSSPVLME